MSSYINTLYYIIRRRFSFLVDFLTKSIEFKADCIQYTCPSKLLKCRGRLICSWNDVAESIILFHENTRILKANHTTPVMHFKWFNFVLIYITS